jgi:hypothetical protein
VPYVRLAAALVALMAVAGASTEQPGTSLTASSNLETTTASLEFVSTFSPATTTAQALNTTATAAYASSRPCAGIRVGTGTNLVHAVGSKPAGTTFCIGPGVHRLRSPVVVKPGDRFIGVSRAVLDGSRVLKSWHHRGRFWFASGQTQDHLTSSDQCSGRSKRCEVRDDVFFDSKPLVAVTHLRQLASGKFFFDYPKHKIYLAENPVGHRVAADVSEHAFAGCYSGPCGSRALISGLTIQHFAGTAVEISDGMVLNNEVRFNHVAGIAVARNGVIDGNYVHDNGLEGLASTGDQPRENLVVENNETARNGWYAGYDMGWEGGGGKWSTGVKNLTIRNNYSHGNNGTGFWFDTNNINVRLERNRIENNAGNGIEYEASFRATIADNIIRGNGFATGGPWLEGAGIHVDDSADVDIYGNDVVDNYDGIGAMERGGRTIGPYGLPQTINLDVHNNTVKTHGRAAGLIQTIGDTSYWTSKNNRFVDNTYRICANAKPFAWEASSGSAAYAYLTWPQWQATRNDAGGAHSTSC